MAIGKKYGGRIKGVPNKSTTFSVKQRLEELGVDLIGDIIKEINRIDIPRDKAKCMLQLLEYCDAKRKAIEVSGEITAQQAELQKIQAMPMNELIETVKTLLPEESK